MDILHKGHIKLLKRALKLGKVFVGVIGDKAYERNRGYKPSQDIFERINAVEKTKLATVVFPTDNLDTKEDLIGISADFIVVGSDWAKKDIYKQYNLTQEWLDKQNIELIYFPYTENISSSLIKAKMKHE